jgi:aspartate 1-decarboxylase
MDYREKYDVMYQIKMLKSKIHGITITEANVHYTGSLTLDTELIEAANMIPDEWVVIVNNSNGERIETYLIAGSKGSGVCCLNGAAARKGIEGDKLIIMSNMWVDHLDAKGWKPIRVFINDKNKIEKTETD